MEYGWMLLRMIFVLGAVCALAYGSLRFALRRLVHMPSSGERRLEVVERIALAPKQSLFVVRAGSQFLLIGSSERGLSTLGELEKTDWLPEISPEPEDKEEEDAPDMHSLIETGGLRAGANSNDEAYNDAPSMGINS